MATLYVGSARRDENGNYKNGAVGDQDGKEVCTQAYYVHKKGWNVLRPKSAEIAKLIAEYMLRACNNDNIGYDQNGRLGIITYGTATTTKTECDCGTLVRQVVKEATGKDPGNFTTANEVSKLEATGFFEEAEAVISSTVLYNGDILVTKTKGHTVVVVSGRERDDSKLKIDGSWGKDTTTRSQEVFGTTADGIVSNQSYGCAEYLPNCQTSSWKFNDTGRGSLLIKAIQTLLKKLGYYTGKIDGLCGRQTVIAIQKFLKAKGFYTGKIDGQMGPATVRGWQQYINSRL